MKNKNEYVIQWKIADDKIHNQNLKIKKLMDSSTLLKDEDGNEIIASTLMVSANQFHKIFLEDFIKIMGLIGNSESKVFSYILANANYNNIPISTANTFVGTYDEIAKSVHTSKQTVVRVMKKLQATNCIIKISAKTYRINPNLISIGKLSQQQEVMQQFNEDLIHNLEEENNESKQ